MAQIREDVTRRTPVLAKKPPAWLGATGAAGGKRKNPWDKLNDPLLKPTGIGNEAMVPNFNTPATLAQQKPFEPPAWMRASVQAGQNAFQNRPKTPPLPSAAINPWGQRPDAGENVSMFPDAINDVVSNPWGQIPSTPERTIPAYVDPMKALTGSFLAANGQAVRSNSPLDNYTYWLPKGLPQYPTGSFFGGGGTRVAGPLDMMGAPDGGDGGGGGGGMSTRYNWGGGGGGGGYGDGGYDYSRIPAWMMGLYQLNYKG